MSSSTRIIKSRIKSINSTRKITKALELVSGAKMRRAVQMAVDSRNYSSTVKRIVDEVRPLINQNSHPLLYGRRQAQNSILIIAASDRGMCGGFNSQLVKKSAEFLKNRTEPVKVITIGKKIENAIRNLDAKIMASFPAISNSPSFEKTKGVGQLAYDEFLNHRADRVFLCYSDFKSTISQIPTIVQLLPIIPENELQTTEHDHTEEDLRENLSESERLTYDRHKTEELATEQSIVFEPTPQHILDHLLPRLIDTVLYQSMLESAASEHSARMMAMRSATDSANEMLDNLTFTFNQARQAFITREISEISAGKAALE